MDDQRRYRNYFGLAIAPVCILVGGCTDQQRTEESASSHFLSSGETTEQPEIERIYELASDEGVFAYARISPDGRYLAYASETGGEAWRSTQTIKVAELATKRIVFEESGIDAYFSTDGQRMIFLSLRDVPSSVSIWDQNSGEVTRDVAPVNLGDYYSWARRDGRDLILTIDNYYYYLHTDRAVLPAERIPPCPDIGQGERPLISKDGMRVTTFVRGTVVVRNLVDCSYVFDTGVVGAKADFSWDGRYIAFHSPKPYGGGYEIQVVDLRDRTVRTIGGLPGSSLFPSWTRDGRVSFRYDGDDYRGFVIASNVLAAAARPLPSQPQHVPARRAWRDIYPETSEPRHALKVVMVWSPWSAHVPGALQDLKRAEQDFAQRGIDVGVFTSADPASAAADVERLVARYGLRHSRIPLAAERAPLTEVHNQVPVTLLFRDGELLDRRLGALSLEQVQVWVESASLSLSMPPPVRSPPVP